MDFFMQELGVPGSQLVLATEQTLYMVFLSLFIGTNTRADYRSDTGGNKSEWYC